MFVKVAIIVACLLLILYVRHYFNHPKERQVMQTSLKEFRFDQLLERQPLVIDDRVPGLEELSNMWFPHNKKQYFSTSTNTWNRTSHKYTLVLHPTEPIEVLVLHPIGKLAPDFSPSPEETLTAISLKPNQVLILPFHTTFLMDKEKGIILGVHDWITRFLP